MSKTIKIHGIIGKSGDREVFIGITTANILHSLSFADVLNEETGNGYQRRFNPHHSLDFRRYIQTPNSTTIPLTLNLRPSYNNSWKIKTLTTGTSQLIIQKEAGKLLPTVLGMVDKLAKRNIIHKNKASNLMVDLSGDRIYDTQVL